MALQHRTRSRIPARALFPGGSTRSRPICEPPSYSGRPISLFFFPFGARSSPGSSTISLFSAAGKVPEDESSLPRFPPRSFSRLLYYTSAPSSLSVFRSPFFANTSSSHLVPIFCSSSRLVFGSAVPPPRRLNASSCLLASGFRPRVTFLISLCSLCVDVQA